MNFRNDFSYFYNKKIIGIWVETEGCRFLICPELFFGLELEPSRHLGGKYALGISLRSCGTLSHKELPITECPLGEQFFSMETERDEAESNHKNQAGKCVVSSEDLE